MSRGKRYSNEFKLETVKLLERSGKSVQTICEELGVSDTSLYKWIALYGSPQDGGERHTPDEHEELIRLRRDLKRVTEERDILKKAVGIFSKELP